MDNTMTVEELRAYVDASMTEKEFQAQVVKLAKARSWLVFHPYSSLRSTEGYPDLTMVRDGVLIFAELKTQKGRTTDAQDHWMRELMYIEPFEAAVFVYLWRPSDWDSITEILE